MFPLFPSTLWMKIGAALALCALMWFLGWNHEHKNFVAFKAEVAAIGKAQEEKNKQFIKEHEQITQGVKDEYEAKLAAVNNYYAIGVQSNSSSGRLPTVGSSPATVDGEAAHRLLARQCAATTLELESLQKWVKLNVK